MGVREWFVANPMAIRFSSLRTTRRTEPRERLCPSRHRTSTPAGGPWQGSLRARRFGGAGLLTLPCARPPD
ncbi:hypothetical protein CBM2589_A70112 [Cupriavidus taiwanensis]|uniref:Uncharacterized protein n=1 Tax=Cupriavidus taiwanensis TaxID=164546 RepID=A0A375C6Y7_9BURK|nr:hypothetical protein CBM2589_A70112 [Cupriavidus taiwanensis]